MIGEMIDEFLSYVGKQIEALAEAAAAGNDDEIQECAHSIKGAAGNLSATRVQSVALSIEQMGRDKKTEGLLPAIFSLKEELAALVEFSETLAKK